MTTTPPHQTPGAWPVYGHQWRNFGATKNADGTYQKDGVDQLAREAQRAGQHVLVRCQCAGNGGKHEAQHVGHEHAIAANAVGQVAAQERADNGAEGDGRCNHAGTGGRQAKFPGNVLQAEGEGAQVIGVQENATERDGYDDARIADVGAALVDECRDIGGGTDDGLGRRGRLAGCLCTGGRQGETD